MHKISALVVFLGAVLSVAWISAAQPCLEPSTIEPPASLISPSAAGELPYGGPCYGRPCCGKHGAAGWCNCNCQGSYKYPVLPQYTYFWPGIYSQQTMTAYVSPRRYPGLLMPNVMAGASEPSPSDSAQVPATPAKAAAQTKPAH